MKTNRKTKLHFNKQTITKLTEATIRGGQMAIAIATQSDQQQTGCHTNCQSNNNSSMC